MKNNIRETNITKAEYDAIMYPPITKEQLKIVAEYAHIGYTDGYNPLSNEAEALALTKFILLEGDTQMFSDEGEYFVYKWEPDYKSKVLIGHSDQYERALIDAVLFLAEEASE